MTIAMTATAGSETLLATTVRQAQIELIARITEASNTVGIADSYLYFGTPAEVDKTLDEMVKMGVKDVRIMIPWAGVEPAPGAFDFTRIDMIVGKANERGMGVLATLNSTPDWAATPGQPAYSGAPVNPAAYANFTSQVATRYAGQISAYEVWNEPNLQQFWSPTPNPAAYVALLQAGYTAIKAADPNATVVGGVVSSAPSNTGAGTTPQFFLEQMYAAGAGGYFDALSYHPYQFPELFTDTSASTFNQLIALRELMVANGDAEKLIWASEYGLPTNVVTEAQQADYITNLLNAWKDITYGGPVFVYTMRDILTGSPNIENNFGVFDDQWNPKAAVAAITAFITAQLPQPQPQPQPQPEPQPQPPAMSFAEAMAAVVQRAVQAFFAAIVQAVSNFFNGFGAPAAPAAATFSAADQTADLERLATAAGEPSPTEGGDIAGAVGDTADTLGASDDARPAPLDAGNDEGKTADGPLDAPVGLTPATTADGVEPVTGTDGTTGPGTPTGTDEVTDTDEVTGPVAGTDGTGAGLDSTVDGDKTTGLDGVDGVGSGDDGRPAGTDAQPKDGSPTPGRENDGGDTEKGVTKGDPVSSAPGSGEKSVGGTPAGPTGTTGAGATGNADSPAGAATPAGAGVS